MSNRSSSPARGQAVKISTYTKVAIPAAAAGDDGRGHKKGAVPKTIATRKPKRWGG